jgi:hypothetical protein
MAAGSCLQTSSFVCPFVSREGAELTALLSRLCVVSLEELANVSDPFTGLDAKQRHEPLFTYPFFGEDEELELFPSAVNSKALPPRLRPESLAILVAMIGGELVNGASAACFIGSNCDGLLGPACMVIQEKLAEFAAAAGLDLKFFGDWKQFQSHYANATALDIRVSPDIQCCSLGDTSHFVLRLVEPATRNALFAPLQILLPFYIEAATFIDASDPGWSVYLLVNAQGRVLGLLTGYAHFCFPEGLRQRVSQVLVLPEQRAQCLGRRLYVHVMQQWRADPAVREIGVEEPTDAFERLRALNDWTEARRLGVWTGADDETRLKTLLAREGPMKLAPRHARRLLLLHSFLLLQASTSQQPPAKKARPQSKPAASDLHRLRVKKHLLSKFSAELPDDPIERKQKLHELWEVEMEEFLEPCADVLMAAVLEQ